MRTSPPWAVALLCGVLMASTDAWAGPAEADAQPESSDRTYAGPGAVDAPTDVREVEPTTETIEASEQPAAPAAEPTPAPAREDVEADAEASPPPRPRHSLVYKNLFAARYNPLGLVNENSLGWRMQLLDRPGVLYQDTFVAAKLHTFVNPAFSRIGPMLEIQPLAVLNLQAIYNYVGYYSTFDQMMSFRTPTAEYSDAVLDDLGDQGRNYPTGGHLLTLAALAQAKVKNIAIRDNVKFYYADMDLRDGDTVYYDQTLDILEPNKGWAVVNDLDLIYLFDFGLKIGARYTVTHAFYQDKHFLPGEPRSQPNGPTHRVGPAILYTFYDKPERRFNRPTLIVLSQWWARHRWRTGVDVGTGVPYLVVGFLFEGDLLPNPRKRAQR